MSTLNGTWITRAMDSTVEINRSRAGVAVRVAMRPRDCRAAGRDRFTARVLDQSRAGGVGDVGQDQQTFLV
jgi:hypothetical protein